MPGREPLLPVIALGGVVGLTQLELVAFGTLAPWIRDAFGLSDGGFTAVVTTGLFVAYAGVLPIGVLADRRDRRRLALTSLLVWIAAAALAGMATGLLMLIVARIGLAVGSLANDPVHASLLTDLYSRRSHPRAFALHEAAYGIGELAGTMAASAAALIGWRGVMVAMPVAALPLLALVFRITEPVRGGAPASGGPMWRTPQDGMSRTDGLLDGSRAVLRSATMRWLLAATGLVGLTLSPMSALMAFFFERVHSVGPYGRGVIGAGVGLGGLGGLALGALLASCATATGMARQVVLIAGGFLAGAAALALMAAAPSFTGAVAGAILAGVFLSAWSPAYWSLLGRLLPPTLRGQGVAWGALALAAGGLPAFLISDLGERHGYRMALATLAVVTAGAGLVALLATRSARREAYTAGRGGHPSFED